MFATMLTNFWTTFSGILFAALNQTVNGPGFKFPANKQEWGHTAVSFAILLLGLASKDATTGSRPQ